MNSSTSVAARHWSRAIRRWPIDKVRPENVSFQKLMQQRLQKTMEPAAASSSTGPATSILSQPWSEERELKQTDALYALLENRFEKKYHLPDNLRHPAYNPTHYDDLVKELEDAPSRSWFGGVMKRLQGSFRLR